MKAWLYREALNPNSKRMFECAAAFWAIAAFTVFTSFGPRSNPDPFHYVSHYVLAGVSGVACMLCLLVAVVPRGWWSRLLTGLLVLVLTPTVMLTVGLLYCAFGERFGLAVYDWKSLTFAIDSALYCIAATWSIYVMIRGR